MDELDDTLALLDDLDQLVNSGRVVVEVDEDLPPRFRPTRHRLYPFDVNVETGEVLTRPDASIEPRD